MFGKACYLTVLAGPNFDGEALLVADIDRDDIPRAKYDFDVTGHYARPDIFSLRVNETNTKPFHFSGAEITSVKTDSDDTCQSLPQKM